MTSKIPPIALTIAGSDSGGGAGIQADLRTFAAFGVHGLSAITAVTAQNTRGVSAIHTVPGTVLQAQVAAVLDDFHVGAIKLGMLATPAIARAVAAALERHRRIPLILDPVLIATTGAHLATESLVGALRTHLFAKTTLLTPNIPEAERLTGLAIRNEDDMRAAATTLRAQGAPAVLLKGGHLPGNAIADLLLTAHGEHWFRQRRLRGESHGTGCSLAAAIAAGMARGRPLEQAVEDAIGFVHRALKAGYRPGKGDLRVLDHLAAMR
ncbi:MAG: bifunctional hydroxymethylpyrimidine kinase/phosphomethylpyrimidine kinase [Rhodanobacteraceae bacterium]|jgi:hydroxymethylpyrimidine/phosphomethylpyrimidine kinase|nr:bifunctional hydroxymethylpyrimidine kinase/phosphomethylpyrimidine kinase [Rhodanobacteraceae bacterium]